MNGSFLPAVAALALLAPLGCVSTKALSQETSSAASAPLSSAPVSSAPFSSAPVSSAPVSSGQSNAAQQPSSSQGGSLSGTVLDVSGSPVPGAVVTLQGASGPVGAATAADESGVFNLQNAPPGTGLHISIQAKGFEPWVSPPIALAAGQTVFVKDIQLKVANAVTSVTVTASTEQIATEQVALEEKQRIFGIIPNFYVVYDSQNAAPMTVKLKFQMALRVSVDPISFAGALTLGAIDQASDNPGYRQGWNGYGQRVGSVFADGFTDTMFGGAILPSLFHQDPRYYYQGTGTVSSRARHALQAPFVCKGDNGKWQPNVSSIGGDLISASISNSYYPQSDRGAALLFENVLIQTAERGASTLIQEFLLRRLTPSAKGKD